MPLTLKPDAAEIHTCLGHAQWQLWRTDEAAASYRRALELKPDQPAALSGLADTLLERGGLAAAEECLRRAVQFDPTAIAPSAPGRGTATAGSPAGRAGKLPSRVGP